MKNLIFAFILIGLLSHCSDHEESFPKQFTGRELFSSIFFLQGNAVNEISQLNLLREEIMEATEGEFDESISMAKDEIIKTISEDDLHFFNHFQFDIQSGDHLRIQKAIEYGTLELKKASKLIYENQIEQLVEEIYSYDESALKEYFGEDQILKINALKAEPKLLKEFLFNDFITKIRNDPTGRQTCIAVFAAVVVVAGGVFDVGISMNVVIGFNYALASYTYVVSSGNTGQTWMFFNAGVINYLASWGGGEEDCEESAFQDCPDEEEEDDEESRSYGTSSNLEFEVFINDIAVNLKSDAS